MYSLDLTVFNLLHNLSGHAQWSDWLIVALAEYLPYVVVVAVVIAGYRSWRRRKNGEVADYIVAFVAGGIARGLTEIIRFFYHHPRPNIALHIVPLFPETSYSFPSGHAVFFFALSAGVYRVNKKFGWILYILSAVICAARVAAGVHWPSDIVAGMVLGIVVAYTSSWIWKHKTKKE